MAFVHEKLDSASEGMLCMRTMVNTGREKSTPIPTPTPKRRSADGMPVAKPPACGSIVVAIVVDKDQDTARDGRNRLTTTDNEGNSEYLTLARRTPRDISLLYSASNIATLSINKRSSSCQQ
jgi:hypothetical protein